MTTYTYILGIDFSAIDIDLGAFQSTIQDSAITSATVQYLTRSGTSVNIIFSGALSGGDITILSGLVAAYIYVAPFDPVYVDTTSVATLTNKKIDTTNTIVDASVSTKVLGFSLSGMSSDSQLTLSGNLSASRTYTFPDAGTNTNIILGASSGTQTISTGNLTIGDTSAVLALSGASSALTLANTTISTSSSTGALQSAGGAFLKNIFVGGVSFTNQAASLVGPLLNVAATTITATNTADMAFVSVQVPTLANSVAASTTTNASTLYIAGAPAAGTNQTITNAFALNVAAGTTRIGGSLLIPTGAVNGYVLTTNGSGLATWQLPSAFIGFADGTVAAPGAFWATSTNTGFYRSGGILISITGTNTASFTTTATTSLVSLVATASGSTTAASSTLYSNPASTALTGSNNYFFNYLNTPTTTGSTTGTASTLYIAGAPSGATTSLALNVEAGNSLFGGNITLNNASAVLALSGASSALTLANTTISTSSSTGALRCLGGGFFKNLFVGGVAFTNQVVSLVGSLFNVAASTITATNTADMAFVSVQQPTLANSVAASTTTNASTVYIADAPAAGTNQTITNTYALNVAAGLSRFGGSIQIPTGAVNGYVLKSNASGLASWQSSDSIYFFATNTTTNSTTSTTLVDIPLMTLTPTVAGTYIITFESTININNNSNRLITFQFTKNNVAITDANTIIGLNNSALRIPVSLSAIVAANGTTDNFRVQFNINNSGSTISSVYKFFRMTLLGA